MEQKNADAIAGLGVSVEFHADQPLKDLKSFKLGSDPKDPQVAAELEKISADYKLTDRSGAVLVEFRQLHNVMYLHADAAGLAKLVGEDPARTQAELESAIGKQGPLHDALTGGWASLDEKTLADFGTDVAEGGDGKAAPAPSDKPSVDPKTADDLLNSLKSIASNDMSFESKGKADGADQVQVTLPFRKLADDLLKAFKPLSEKLPQHGAKWPEKAPDDTPDKNVTADLSIKNGTLVGVRFDLAQLDKKATADQHLPLKVAIDPNAPAVQAPAQATKFTKDELGDLFHGLVSSFAARADAGDDDQQDGGGQDQI
ncbi:hypothetical protein [Kitasatospora kifunensis]|uniref:Uncharacterized protein n=1 Tax=Kitasatospora kifunensis TaxID=58351 RepID=A0A7W7VSX6_KITKI|nr:hypothetical protein [Kitasatospora kifunensis]MBB4921646.1 hypothetical protein [Kitasatospora kifunensis]